jgi:CheY-like chemotaxis protein
MNDYQSMRRQQELEVVKTYELPDADIPEPPKAKKILVLEDEVAFAILLKEDLEAEGYQVTVVSNGAEGLKKILTTDFEIIICDMVMPNFPGDMFYLAVERARPDLCKRFIFMTGHQGDVKIREFIRRIRGLMLWKPFETHVLFDAIKVVSGKK